MLRQSAVLLLLLLFYIDDGAHAWRSRCKIDLITNLNARTYRVKMMMIYCLAESWNCFLAVVDKSESEICANGNMMSNANRHLRTNNCHGKIDHGPGNEWHEGSTQVNATLKSWIMDPTTWGYPQGDPKKNEEETDDQGVNTQKVLLFPKSNRKMEQKNNINSRNSSKHDKSLNFFSGKWRSFFKLTHFFISMVFLIFFFAFRRKHELLLKLW